jgi:hypothetical protein
VGAAAFCSKCGASNLAGARFCSFCGAAMAVPAAPPAGAAPPGAYGSVSASGPWEWQRPPPVMSGGEAAPTAAGVLSIIGGILILLGGIAEVFVGAAVTSVTLGAQGQGLTALGVLGALMGLFILVLGILLLTSPDSHITCGVLILIFSLISLTSFFGGFFLGFLLSLIGAILALTWHPEDEVIYAQPPPGGYY